MIELRDDSLISQFKRLSWLRYDLMPLPYWYGKEFRKTRAFLEKSQWWNQDRLRKYQWEKIKQLLEHSYQNVPFYQERFKKLGLCPDDIRSFEDFRKIPPLTKDDLKNNLEKLKASNFEKWRPIETKTGGTTGSPVKLYRSKNSDVFVSAIYWRGYNWAGYFYGDKRIGYYPVDRLKGDAYKKQKQWVEDYKEKELTIDTSYLDEKAIEFFVRCFKWYKPKAIYSSSLSSLKVLATYLCSHKIEEVKPKAVLTVGEVLSDFDREFLESSFKCKVFDRYGMRENTVSAYQCREGNCHINSELALMEFEKEGKPAEAGQLANIIGTNLHNYAVPLIRYSTQDLGYYIDEKCACGRGLPLMKIVGGRSRDFLVTKRGLVAVSSDTTKALGKDLKIDGIQFCQEDLNSILVKVIRRNDYTEEDEILLMKSLNELFKGEFKIDLEYVQDIPRTSLGKYRFVVSKIPAEL